MGCASLTADHHWPTTGVNSALKALRAFPLAAILSLAGGILSPSVRANTSQTFWEATLTTGNYTSGRFVLAGYTRGIGSLNINFGSLSDNTFEFRGTEYTIHSFWQVGESCHIHFSPSSGYKTVQDGGVEVTVGSTKHSLSDFSQVTTAGSKTLNRTVSCGLSNTSGETTSISLGAPLDVPKGLTTTGFNTGVRLR